MLKKHISSSAEGVLVKSKSSSKARDFYSKKDKEEILRFEQEHGEGRPSKSKTPKKNDGKLNNSVLNLNAHDIHDVKQSSADGSSSVSGIKKDSSKRLRSSVRAKKFNILQARP